MRHRRAGVKIVNREVNLSQDDIDEAFKMYYRRLQRLNEISKQIYEQDQDEILRIIAEDLKSGRKCDCG
jgi:hypothetical protein